MEELYKGWYDEQKAEEIEWVKMQLQMWDSHFMMIT